MKQKRQLDINIGKLYVLVIIKWTKALKAELWSLAAYKDLYERSDAIKLIRSIKIMAFKFEAHENLNVVTFVLKSQIGNTCQHDMSPIDYLKMF